MRRCPILKRFLLCLFFATATLAVASTWLVKTSGDPDYRFNLTPRIVNDITGLNPIAVGQVVQPVSTEAIATLLANSSGPVSIGGGRFSQGGQTAYPGSLHIDMRKMNRVLHLDLGARTITVQAGATWRDIQDAIDPHDLSVRIMQTYSNFTVGGSLSVNVHGRYIGEGPLIHSVESLQLVLADGRIVNASRNENTDIFFGAIGGYGGLGVITQATLHLAENSKIERRTQKVATSGYKQFFFDHIRNKDDVVFQNADLYPPHYDTALNVSWHKTDKPLTHDERLIARDETYYWGPRAAEFVANYSVGKWIRQHLIDPVYYTFDRVVWRNWEASYDVRELEPASREEKTYVLREYFVPVDRFDEFVPEMRDIFNSHHANIINVSIRHAHKDPEALLSWAREESFAFVVYYQQGTDADARQAVREWSLAMIDAVTAVGGSYYLPYQVFESPDQFAAAYPRAPEFFALKKRLDPDYRFRNTLWSKVYAPQASPVAASKAAIADYNRGEEQTFLTIPEWYLVFNPVEYAEHLKHRNPSDFPFFDSINEYWALYDRVSAITQGIYPANPQYMTMLQVIGISTTVEYALKGAYENTLGRFSRWTTDNNDTAEDTLIQRAHQAYSELIFIEPWYKFDFMHWVKAIWTEPTFWGEHFFRKLERKVFFTAEFMFKAGYARLIGFAAQTAYDPSSGLIYATVRTEETASFPAEVTLLASEGDTHLIAIPRWGVFSNVVPALARQGARFVDISGNALIAVSAIGPGAGQPIPEGAELLFESPLVSDASQYRQVLLVDVPALQQVLIALDDGARRIEHIYDY